MAKNFGKVNVSITASTGGLTAGLASASKQLSGFKSSLGGMGNVFAESLKGAVGLGRGATVAAVGVSVLTESLRALLAPLAIVAAVTAPFVAFAQATAAAEQLHNLSQELQVATGDLQVLQAVGGEFGLSTEQMTGALRRSTRMVSELAAGTPAAQKAFAQLGLTMNDMAGMDASQQFALIADRIAALPPQMQAAAAIDIFGRSGQSLLPFLRQGGEGLREMDTLLTNLGVKMSGPQVAAIEAMGDALGRLALPVQGFVNQFLANVAPAITAVSQILLEFATASGERFSFAEATAKILIGTVGFLIGVFTVGYGTLQMFAGGILGIGSAATIAFGFVTEAVGRLLQFLGRIVPGLAAVGKSIAKFGVDTQVFGDALGVEAGKTFMQGIKNFENPLQNFDARMAQARSDAEAAAVKKVAAGAGESIGQSIQSAVRASSAELKAIVVGSSEGESFRNSIMRGADPRLDVKQDAKRTADATERSADLLDDIAGNLQGVALATIAS